MSLTDKQNDWSNLLYDDAIGVPLPDRGLTGNLTDEDRLNVAALWVTDGIHARHTDYPKSSREVQYLKLSRSAWLRSCYETEDGERLPRYNPDEVEDLGEARSSRSTTSDDGGSDGGDVAQEDGDEGNNVFMYDGTAAGSGLMDYQYDGSEMALEYDPAIGLDELSRLSL
jgi:hypothetical protein